MSELPQIIEPERAPSRMAMLFARHLHAAGYLDSYSSSSEDEDIPQTSEES